MASQGVLSYYEEALTLTKSMLDAASKGAWDELVRLEQQRTRTIERIKQEDPNPVVERSATRKKQEIVAAMLKADEQIQLLTQDWMHELREVLTSLHTEQRLNRTYDP